MCFAKMTVGVEKPDASGQPSLEIVPSRRPITVQDLVRHTSGITYGFFGPGLVKKAYNDANIGADAPDNAQFSQRIAKLPLAHQPGTPWDYSYSTDILGRVVEVVSGKSLLAFEKERLLDPLGMSDTRSDPRIAVRRATGEAAYPGEAGEYYWGGAGGTCMWVDPKSDMFVIFMMQSPKQRLYYRGMIRNMVYAALLK